MNTNTAADHHKIHTGHHLREPFFLLITGLIVGLSLIAFMWVSSIQQQRFADDMRLNFNEMTDVLELSLQRNVQTLVAIRALFASSEDVQREEFITFTRPFLEASSEIYAISWAQRVPGDQLGAFESSIRSQGIAGFSVFEIDPVGYRLPVVDRGEYFPLTFSEPIDINQTALGFDIGSEPERLEVLAKARDNNQVAFSGPLDLVHDLNGQLYILALMPVYRNTQPIHTLEARRANLLGLAIGAFQMSELVKKAEGSIIQHDIEFYLYDVNDPDNPRFLAFYPSQSGAQTLPPGGAPAPNEVRGSLFMEERLQIYDREWLAIARPGPAYARTARGWAEWVSLFIGLMLAGAFMTYVDSRHKTEAILARSEAEFRSLSDNALTGVLRLTATGEILYANEALANMLGFPSPLVLIGQDISDYFPSRESAHLLDKLLNSSRQMRNQMLDITAANGEKRYLLYSAALHEGRISATVVDLTDRIRSEDEIRQLSRIVSQMADTVVITDVDGKIEYVNPAFEDLTGYERTDTIGHTPRILKSGQHGPEFYQRLWDTILRGEVFQSEMINRKKTGELYFEVKTITPIRNSEGVITHFAATGKDITEHKKAAVLQETVYRIADAAQTADSLQELYPLIHQHISCVMHAENFYIGLVDDATGLMRYVYQVHEQEPSNRETTSLENDLAARVLQGGKSLLYHEGGEPIPGANGSGGYCSVWLGAPLIVHGRTMGVVATQYYSDAQVFTEREQQILEFVSAQVATAIDRKQAEDAVRQSQASLEMAQSVAHLGSWELDLTTGTGFWSKEMFNLFGLDPAGGVPHLSEFMGMVHPNDRARLQDALTRAGQADAPLTVEYRSNPELGDEKFYRTTIQTALNIDAAQGKLLATVLDVTEIALAQRELEALNRSLEQRVEERTEQVRQSEAVYRALFENSNDGIFLLTPDGEEVMANQRALEMVEYSAEEYQALSKSQANVLASPEQRQEASEYFAAVVQGEHVPLYERTFISKSGKKIQTEINLSAVRDADGKAILVQSVVRDITERKKAGEALRLSHAQLSIANAALEKATRLKDEFLASMSHELRTPLTGILGLSEVLQMPTYGPLSEKQLKAVKNIESSGRHLLELINDILDLSKIEAGKLDLQIAPCAVVDACQASLQMVKGMAHQKNQQINFSIEPAAITLLADLRRLKQMLVNLLSNAVKFTPPGGRLGLEVRGCDADRVIRLCVWDEGIGIKPEDLGKLFKPFVQLDSSLARQYAGTGLGLSLVQRMAELHGGSVEAESAPGVGSRFTIVLPWISAEAQAEDEAERLAGEPIRSSLIIEDNILDAEHVSRYLNSMDISNVIQPVFRGALEHAAALNPSVILLDLYLPDGFGLDLLAELKTDPRTHHIPVIITSVEEKRTEAMRLGAAGYLVKPFVQQDLRLELEKTAGSTRPEHPVMVIAPPTSGALVMIADDNEMILDMVSGYLSTRGYRVITTRSGTELLEKIPESHPDILLVDIQMPGMDGMETIQRLRASNDPAVTGVPIIAVTALAMTGDREKCLQAGADDYLSKPIVLAQLAKRIEYFLRVKNGR